MTSAAGIGFPKGTADPGEQAAVNMDFASEYPKLEAAQERFRRVVSRLLAGQILIPGSALTPDRDWCFAERYSELIDRYLQIGGWRLDLDPVQRLCRAIHQAGTERVRLSKQESLVLCMLRLIYHEQMQRASEHMRCEATTGSCASGSSRPARRPFRSANERSSKT